MTKAPERAGVFIRVSSGAQDEQNQVPDVERHCAGRGYSIGRRYTVHGKSAYKGEHQADLDQVIADIRAGVITVLVIWHSDRLERRPGKALLDILAEVAAAGGRVESVQEPALGQLDFGGQVTTFIAGLVNHEKSKHISDQVRIANDKIRANGGILGQGAGWGFDVTGPKYAKKLAPSAEGRKYAPEVFAMVEAGDSLRKAADFLEAATGRPWWPRTVAAIIRNPAFRGMVHARECAPDGRFLCYGALIHRVEPVVDAPAWKRANDALDAARTRKAGPPDTGNTSLLSAILRCLRCDDSPMYRVRGGDGALWYRCTGRGRRRKGCRNLVSLAAADALMNEVMSGHTRPVTERKLIQAGHDHEAAIVAVGYDLEHLPKRRLDEDAEDAERARLRAERKRLRGLPAVPEEWADVPTGETYGQLWQRSTLAERRAWLRKADFRVYAGKPGMVARGGDDGHPEDLFSRFDDYVNDKAALVFEWTGGDFDAGFNRGLPEGDAEDGGD